MKEHTSNSAEFLGAVKSFLVESIVPHFKKLVPVAEALIKACDDSPNIESIISHLRAIRHFIRFTEGKVAYDRIIGKKRFNALIQKGQAFIIQCESPYAEITLSGSRKKDDVLREKKLNEEQIRLYYNSKFDSVLLATWCRAIEKKQVSRKIFISYAWPIGDYDKEAWIQPFLKQMTEHLVSMGFQVYLDETHGGPGYSLAKFMDKLNVCDHVLLISSRTMPKKFANSQSGAYQERYRIIQSLKGHSSVFVRRKIIPVLLNYRMHIEDQMFATIPGISMCEEGYIGGLKKIAPRVYGENISEFDLWFDDILKSTGVLVFNGIPGLQVSDFSRSQDLLGDIENKLQSESVLALCGQDAVKTEMAVAFCHSQHAKKRYQKIYWFENEVQKLPFIPQGSLVVLNNFSQCAERLSDLLQPLVNVDRLITTRETLSGVCCINVQDPVASRGLAEVHVRKSRKCKEAKDQAGRLKHLMEAYRLCPSHPAVNYNFAEYFFEEKKEYERALGCISVCISGEKNEKNKAKALQLQENIRREKQTAADEAYAKALSMSQESVVDSYKDFSDERNYKNPADDYFTRVNTFMAYGLAPWLIIEVVYSVCAYHKSYANVNITLAYLRMFREILKNRETFVRSTEKKDLDAFVLEGEVLVGDFAEKANIGDAPHQIKYLQGMMKVFKRKRYEDNRFVDDALMFLGEAYYAMRDLEKAREIGEFVLKRDEQLFGVNKAYSGIAKKLFFLAKVYATQGECKVACDLCFRAYRMWQTLTGNIPRGEDILDVLSLLEAVIDKMTAEYFVYAHELSGVHDKMIELYEARGNIDEANRHFQMALMYTTELSEKCAKHANYGLFLFGHGQYLQAIENFQSCVAFQTSLPRPSPRVLAPAYRYMINAYDQLNNSSARDVTLNSFRIYVEENPVAKAWESLAGTYKYLRQQEQHEACLDRMAVAQIEEQTREEERVQKEENAVVGLPEDIEAYLLNVKLFLVELLENVLPRLKPLIQVLEALRNHCDDSSMLILLVSHLRALQNHMPFEKMEGFSALMENGEILLKRTRITVAETYHELQEATVVTRQNKEVREAKLVAEQAYLDANPLFQGLLRKVWHRSLERKLVSKRIVVSYALSARNQREEVWIQMFLRRFASHLSALGFCVFLDEAQGNYACTLSEFSQKIHECDHVIVVSTPNMRSLLHDHENPGFRQRHEMIRALKYQPNFVKQRKVIPVLLNYQKYIEDKGLASIAEVPFCVEGYLGGLMKLVPRLYGDGFLGFESWFDEALKREQVVVFKNVPHLPPAEKRLKRTNLLEKIENKLLSHPVVALTGDAGTGKTELAITLCHSTAARGCYHKIYWFDDTVKELPPIPANSLVVLDGLINCSQRLVSLLSILDLENTAVLITTCETISYGACINIPAFTEAEALQYVKSNIWNEGMYYPLGVQIYLNNAKAGIEKGDDPQMYEGEMYKGFIENAVRESSLAEVQLMQSPQALVQFAGCNPRSIFEAVETINKNRSNIPRHLRAHGQSGFDIPLILIEMINASEGIMTITGAPDEEDLEVKEEENTATIFKPSQRLQPWGLPVNNPLFTGREDLLKTLEKQLAYEPFAKVAPVAVTACDGMGGIGKTSLAIYFAHEHLSNYRFVVWIRAESAEQIRAAFIQLAEHLKITPSVEGGKRYFEENPGNLLIFDDAPNYEVVKPFIPLTGSAVLITSRTQDPKWPQNIAIPVFSEDDARKYVLRVLGQRPLDTLNEIDDLCKAVGYLPLALAQAIAYIQVENISIREYLELLDAIPAEMFNTAEMPVLAKHIPAYKTFDLAIRAIEQKNPQAFRLLAFCALVKGQKSVGMLFDSDGCGTAAGLLYQYSLLSIDENYRFDMHDVVREIVLQRLSIEEKVRYFAEFGELYESCIVFGKLTTELDVCRNQGSLHALPRHWGKLLESIESNAEKIRGAQLSEQLEQLLKTIKKLGVVNCDFQGEDFEDKTEVMLEKVEFLENILRVFGKLQICKSTIVSDTLYDLSELYETLRQLPEKISTLQRAVSAAEESYGPMHANIAVLLHQWGAALHSIDGDFGQLKEIYERAYQINHHCYGETHYLVGLSLFRLGLLYFSKGEIDTAEPLVSRAYYIYKNCPHTEAEDSDTQRVGVQMRQIKKELRPYAEKLEKMVAGSPEDRTLRLKLAGVYLNVSEVEKAVSHFRVIVNKVDNRSVLESALPVMVSQFGNNHLSAGILRCYLANLYSEEDEMQRRAELFEEALPALIENYGKNHPQIGVTLFVLGNAYTSLRNREKADDCIEKALPLLEKGDEDSQKMASKAFTMLGFSYCCAGSYDKVQAILEKGCVLDEMLFGPVNAKLATKLYLLVWAYYYQNLYKQSIDNCLRVYPMLLDEEMREVPTFTPESIFEWLEKNIMGMMEENPVDYEALVAIHYNVAELYESRGDTPAAERHRQCGVECQEMYEAMLLSKLQPEEVWEKDWNTEEIGPRLLKDFLLPEESPPITNDVSSLNSEKNSLNSPRSK